ncbi:MAG: carboxymuconolactone decarboxylase family protein [Alphaproteobacteria bacterium]|jgi:alkylhydroperoxidase family enzyme|nr:carboxymuconolactone decarboxylase family protein [Rhodospirillaceae bacterium]MDP6022944.1 carboxymuconolactone decarboxylase family protein [Alphaproteobacteria bacterium]MDP6253785.1 carboxymuconolactone decarboxylase family protein [Alphaproteobacteria bacterium]MDP7055781.1 carboxymuconolactone decarboxylase family protein [Alphaproteobacteria bacterium]MDP7230478.1 carboxymuconolactone decarboxylase family protein [Alphaproteobacteria bacterium]|tara:strand:- start:7486 stop:8010 length:525 start_codon:yes stop_codon:yes gene_type:complete
MARIDYSNTDHLSDRGKTIMERLNHKNIFRMLSHSESHLVNYCRLGNVIRDHGKLDACLRELAITRVGILLGAEYEVIAHKNIGRRLGIREAQIKALEEGSKSDAFNELEKAVLDYADDLVDNANPGAGAGETFERVAAHLDAEEMVELTIAITFYIMTSKFLITFGIDLESSS